MMDKLKSIEKEEKDQDNVIEIKKGEIEKDLVQISSTIRTVGEFRIGEKFSYVIPNQIISLMYERIITLMHINCPNELQCPYCFTFPNSIILQKLKTAVITSFSNFSENNQEFQDYLINSHNILHHIRFSIISFIYSYNHNWNSNEIQLQSDFFISPSLIQQSIFFLRILVYKNSPNCISISNIPNFLALLIELTQFNLRTCINQSQDKKTLTIKIYSQICLRSIHKFGDNAVQQVLIASGYVFSLIKTISTAGGSGDENESSIGCALSNIKNLFIILNYSEIFGQTQVLTQPILSKISYEQIEEECGSEEIEAHLVNSGYDYENDDYVKYGSIQTKYDMNNFYVDLTNQLYY